jgi:hypothetical protein
MARQIGKMLNAREPKIVNGPEILNKFVGQSEENIRKLFGDAEKEVSTGVFNYLPLENQASDSQLTYRYSTRRKETSPVCTLSFSMNWTLSVNSVDQRTTEPE